MHSPSCTPLPPAACLVLSLFVGTVVCDNCVSTIGNLSVWPDTVGVPAISIIAANRFDCELRLG